MSDTLPVVYLVRHGETAWSLTGQHTGRHDLPLTERGEHEATCVAARLRGLTFAAVFSSPLQRAMRTCELAGFTPLARIEADLAEWDYGHYQGRRAGEILRERPDWQLFRDGCPGGESPQQVAERADRMVNCVRAIDGNTILFSSGHLLRMFAIRWLGLEPHHGRWLHLSTASVSVLGYEHNRAQPIVRLWNDIHHVEHFI